jgi:hypothetical protein
VHYGILYLASTAIEPVRNACPNLSFYYIRTKFHHLIRTAIVFRKDGRIEKKRAESIGLRRPFIHLDQHAILL